MKRKILVLFDIGAVLIKLDYGEFYREAAKHSTLDADAIERAYVERFLDDQTNRGDINAEQFYRELRGCLEQSKDLTDKQLGAIIEHKFAGTISEMIQLKKELHEAGYAVGLLSNIGEESHKILLRIYPEIFTVYDPRNPAILSYQMKAMKPDKRVYEAITGFERVIFIDDKERYLQVCIEKGWKGIHYTQYPDENEPQRKSHSDFGYTNENLRRANSLADVKKALQEFGVRV